MVRLAVGASASIALARRFAPLAWRFEAEFLEFSKLTEFRRIF